MTSHINFLRKACTLPVHRIKTDIHHYMESFQTDDFEISTKLKTYAVITGLRAEGLHVAGQQKTFRRIYVLCPDTGSYGTVGWILSGDAENCMVCGILFPSSTGVKHHCRACGNVVCDKCSENRAIVHPIEDLGPLRVCQLCYFGQSPVDAIHNMHLGRPVLGDFSAIDDESDDDDYERNLWEFGKIEIMEIRPCFVIKTRRPNRSVVYVNLCSCPAVPHNPLAVERDDSIIYMVCGEKGVAVNDHSVYDIAVSPAMMSAAARNPTCLSKLCEQALIALTMLAREKDFHNYSIENTTSTSGTNYMQRKVNNVANSKAKGSSTPPSSSSTSNEQFLVETKTLAIPSKLAFQNLYQVSTKLNDALIPAAIALNGHSTEKRHHHIHHHVEHHKERISAKLLCRTISQIRVAEKTEMTTTVGPSRDSRHLSIQRPDKTLEEKSDSPSSYTTGATSNGNSFVNASSSKHHRRTTSEPAARVKSDPSWHSIFLSPNPGFVIKTWRADDPDEKVFINVFHSEVIDAILEAEDYALPDDQQPFCAFGDMNHAEDKEGKPVQVFQVIIGSSYFIESYITSEKKITDEDRIHRIIDSVNGKFESKLDPMDFVILRVKGGFKGTWSDTMNFMYRLPSRQFVVRRKKNHHNKKGNDDANQRLTTLLANGRSPRVTETDTSPSSSRRDSDGGSDVSEASATSSRSSRKSIRSSIAGVFGLATDANDFDLTPDMFLYKPQESIDWQDIVVLKHYSIEKPDVLMGWQITRLGAKGSSSEHYVITGIRKSSLSKTEYRLSAYGKQDIWCKLKRGEKKSGYPFRPNRKVLFLQDDEKENTKQAKN